MIKYYFIVILLLLLFIKHFHFKISISDNIITNPIADCIDDFNPTLNDGDVGDGDENILDFDDYYYDHYGDDNNNVNYKPDDEEIGGHFEGDMILSSEQIDLIVDGYGDRNGLLNAFQRWPNNLIPFEIDMKKYAVKHLKQIYKVFRIIQSVSCIKFRPRIITDIDYIFITDDKSGCNSEVGRKGGRQILHLKKNQPGMNCFRLGSIIHELLHALGFYHMQSTGNRDDYVNIIWDNIKESFHHNFRSYSANLLTSYGLPYDYDSVMHYSNKAFSRNGSITIQPKNSSVTIGQRTGLSSIDIEKLNIMYNCYAD